MADGVAGTCESKKIRAVSNTVLSAQTAGCRCLEKDGSTPKYADYTLCTTGQTCRADGACAVPEGANTNAIDTTQRKGAARYDTKGQNLQNWYVEPNAPTGGSCGWLGVADIGFDAPHRQRHIT